MRVMHAPQKQGHGIEANLRTINKIRPRSVGFTEMARPRGDDIATARRLLTGYTVCAPPPGATRSREVPVAVKQGRRVTMQGCQTQQIAPRLGRGGITNDRYQTTVRFAFAGNRYAHIATHWHAVLQRKPDGGPLTAPRVKAMERAAQLLTTQIQALQQEGREVFVTGDFNYRTYTHKDFQLWEHSPQRIFKRLGMRHHAQGLDYLAWTDGMRLVGKVRVFPAGSPENRSDHPWLLGNFKRK